MTFISKLKKCSANYLSYKVIWCSIIFTPLIIKAFITFCDSGYKYAGLQARTWCTCGDTYGRFGSAPNSQCNMACPRGRGTCGAGWRNSIYKTKAPAGKYLGCFKDTWQRDLPQLTNVGNSNKVSTCIKSCSDTGETLLVNLKLFSAEFVHIPNETMLSSIIDYILSKNDKLFA